MSPQKDGETVGHCRPELRGGVPGKGEHSKRTPWCRLRAPFCYHNCYGSHLFLGPQPNFALRGKASLSSKLPVHLTILCFPSKNTYHSFLAVFFFFTCFLWSAFEIFVVVNKSYLFNFISLILSKVLDTWRGFNTYFRN